MANPEWQSKETPKKEDLPIETLFRFAEIELSYAIPAVMHLFPDFHTSRNKAIRFLLDAIKPLSTVQFQNDWQDAINSQLFRRPLREELVYYFVVQGSPYRKITSITRISPNTISKYKYDYFPRFPVFAHWDEEMLNRWDGIKGKLNIFNEELQHHREMGGN